MIMSPRSSRGGSGDNSDGSVAAVEYISMRKTIYIPYKELIKYVQTTAVYKNWDFRLVLLKNIKVTS